MPNISRYIHTAGVFSDTLLQAAKQFNLYDLGYAATGICVYVTPQVL